MAMEHHVVLLLLLRPRAAKIRKNYILFLSGDPHIVGKLAASGIWLPVRKLIAAAKIIFSSGRSPGRADLS